MTDIELKNLIRAGNYSANFDELRANRCAVSAYKYGPAKQNFGRGYVNALGCVQKCIDKYKETLNTEYLCDAANYIMFEFMYPSLEGARFTPTDSNASAGIDGISVREMEELRNADSTYIPGQ